MCSSSWCRLGPGAAWCRRAAQALMPAVCLQAQLAGAVDSKLGQAQLRQEVAATATVHAAIRHGKPHIAREQLVEASELPVRQPVLQGQGGHAAPEALHSCCSWLRACLMVRPSQCFLGPQSPAMYVVAETSQLSPSGQAAAVAWEGEDHPTSMDEGSYMLSSSAAGSQWLYPLADPLRYGFPTAASWSASGRYLATTCKPDEDGTPHARMGTTWSKALAVQV